jgi:hypothetical protein
LINCTHKEENGETNQKFHHGVKQRLDKNSTNELEAVNGKLNKRIFKI